MAGRRAHWVVDTNVAVTANGGHPRAEQACRERCIEALEQVRAGRLCLDESRQILDEYFRRLSPSGEPGPGDAFLYWVLQNEFNPNHVLRVAIEAEGDELRPFPDDAELAGFDRSDRKFVAVALASRRRPTILNATDRRSWWAFRAPLERHGLRIRFLCPQLMEG